MSQFTEAPTKTFIASGALGKHLRVKDNGSGLLALAGTSDIALGTLERDALAANDPVAVRLPTAQGTRKMVASEAITAYALVYAGASGKVAATGTIVEGRAMEAATTNGDVIEVLPHANTDVSAAITGTTAATFEADSDLGKPRTALGSQTGGTGDFKAVIRPPSTLGADRIFTLAGDANATLANATGAQTWTGVKTFSDEPPVFSEGFLSTAQAITPNSSEVAGNMILPGVTNVDVGAVTTNADDFFVLPAIAGVPIGHTINIAINAGGNCEMRTPASSNTKINDVDSDGTQEYLCTDTHLIKVVKRTTTGWVATSYTKLGAVVTAVIPD